VLNFVGVLNVHYLDPPSLRAVADLQQQVAGVAYVTHGLSNQPLGTGLQYDILIGAYPKQCHLAAKSKPRTLIIPFSGLPPSTRLLLLKFPWIPVYRICFNVFATAEMAIALLLTAAKDVVRSDTCLRKGRWICRPLLRTLHDKKALILGFGQLGRRVRDLLIPFGMRGFVARRNLTRKTLRDSSVFRQFPMEALDSILPDIDVIIVCLPLTPETKGLISEHQLRLIRDDCIIINVARADVIEERALYNALALRPSLTAGLDVWYREPTGASRGRLLPSRFPFHRLQNLVMTPHRAWRTCDAERERTAALADALQKLAHGERVPHRVNITLGY
jgi:phosphoglycerate dehydrogenase-like enzyme